MTHICVGNLTIIGSDNGLSPGRRQAIIWTNAGLLSIGTFWKFNQNSYIFIHENAFESVVWKMSTILSRPQCVNAQPQENCRCFFCLAFLTPCCGREHEAEDQFSLNFIRLKCFSPQLLSNQWKCLGCAIFSICYLYQFFRIIVTVLPVGAPVHVWQVLSQLSCAEDSWPVNLEWHQMKATGTFVKTELFAGRMQPTEL